MIKKIKKEQMLIAALLGILLLVIAIPLPGGDSQQEHSENTAENVMPEKAEMQEQLQSILQTIDGVGRTKVLLTYEDQGRLVVEKDESVSEELVQETDSSGGTRTTTTAKNDRETVYDSTESPYIIQELSPKVQGVLVVAEGGGNVSVKKQIQETIQALFGLESHKISIMKMEVSK